MKTIYILYRKLGRGSWRKDKHKEEVLADNPETALAELLELTPEASLRIIERDGLFIFTRDAGRYIQYTAREKYPKLEI